MKTTFILVLLGALLGIIAASFLVPPMLSWYTEPGGLPQGASVQALVQVPSVIKYATSKLIQGQMIGGGLGAVGGLVLGVVLARRGRLEPGARP